MTNANSFDLDLCLTHRYEVAHRAQEGYTTPVVVLREADYGEAYPWRKKEAGREAARRRRHLARLKKLGWSEDEFADLQLQNEAMLAASAEHFARLSELKAPEAPAPVEGEEAVEFVPETEEEREAREAQAEELAAAYERDVQEPWRDLATRFQLYQDLVDGEDYEELGDVEHTLKLVMACTTAIEGISLEGEPVDWAKLSGERKRRVFERLLGPAAQGMAALSAMARLITQGLTEGQKKA
jgi:hypothetical protein